jgi:hypothetical protein
MTRFVIALAAAAIASLAAPGLSAAQTSPTLTLEEACTTSDGTRLAGVKITSSGVPPFGAVSGSVRFPDGGTISGSISADAGGVATITFFSGPGLYTVRIDSPFSALQSLEVDCLPNDKDECRNGGWQTFEVFKNQGDCVSFVATGGKNPPAGGP